EGRGALIETVRVADGDRQQVYARLLHETLRLFRRGHAWLVSVRLAQLRDIAQFGLDRDARPMRLLDDLSGQPHVCREVFLAGIYHDRVVAHRDAAAYQVQVRRMIEVQPGLHTLFRSRRLRHRCRQRDAKIVQRRGRGLQDDLAARLRGGVQDGQQRFGIVEVGGEQRRAGIAVGAHRFEERHSILSCNWPRTPPDTPRLAQAQRVPNSRHAGTSLPSSQARTNPASKLSPAPTASTTFIGPFAPSVAAICQRCPLWKAVAPSPPRLTTTSGPNSASRLPASSTSAAPEIASASASFGRKTSTSGNRSWTPSQRFSGSQFVSIETVRPAALQRCSQGFQWP